MAGRGREGAGETDLLIDGDELKDERRLGVKAGGFIGKGNDIGVPGAEGVGDPTANEEVSPTNGALDPNSGGAGLWEDILLEGKSILANFPCWARVN